MSMKRVPTFEERERFARMRDDAREWGHEWDLNRQMPLQFVPHRRAPEPSYVLSSTSAEEFNARITALENALKVFDEINKELVAQVIQLQSENKENFDAWLQKTPHPNTD